MSGFEIFRVEKAYYAPDNAMQFWETTAATNFARLACNHGYGHCLILHGANRTCDSLNDFMKYAPLSEFSYHMRAG